MQEFPVLVSSAKTISVFPGWSAPEKETGYMWFDVPLEIDGITVAGLNLHGGCYERHPQKHVTFELRIGRSPGRKCLPLIRMCWRSLQGGHSNPRLGTSEWAGIRVSDTHLHSFELNWLPEEVRMRGQNLRIAREIDEQLDTFSAVKRFVGINFNINNIDLVTNPNWVYDLFHDG